MRNSNVLAIAPTATISNICGVSQSIEPIYRNLFVKSNMSGEFTVANPYLVADLKARGLWDQVMVSDLKYHDGILSQIDRVPADLRELYATAFEMDPLWLVKAASRRQKWLDQAQSLNLYMSASVRQGAGRAVPVGLALRAQDHVLPALAVGHARGEVHPARNGRPAQRSTGCTCCGRSCGITGHHYRSTATPPAPAPKYRWTMRCWTHLPSA